MYRARRRSAEWLGWRLMRTLASTRSPRGQALRPRQRRSWQRERERNGEAWWWSRSLKSSRVGEWSGGVRQQPIKTRICSTFQRACRRIQTGNTSARTGVCGLPRYNSPEGSHLCVLSSEASSTNARSRERGHSHMKRYDETTAPCVRAHDPRRRRQQRLKRQRLVTPRLDHSRSRSFGALPRFPCYVASRRPRLCRCRRRT